MPGSGNCACGSIAFTYNGEHIPNLQEGKTKNIHQANLPLRRFATVPDVNSGVEAHFHPMSPFQLATLRSAKERPKVGLALQMYLEKSIVTSSVEVNCGSSLYSQPEGMPGVTQIKSGNLHDTEIPIGVEIFSTRRLNYVTPISSAKQTPEMP
ncbi:hypothetical protein N7509_013039 [Penicillium cosmopolitanum]|uniref:Uncharacterized protein n=1 Tax=Penicillium cosmopolitanum TaxID=1131564 RepID=A0A9W9SH88_9EURO|nr:uncharacterized protein N7509_013039 [Penicillium cosmopolitanum]KAJ5376153.1 hypothetical protein N7509_013039 [Penicillium cosmopolitanum]